MKQKRSRYVFVAVALVLLFATAIVLTSGSALAATPGAVSNGIGWCTKC